MTPAGQRSWLAGRGTAAQIRLQAADIAEEHCVFTEYPEGIAVCDLGSPAGTFVNGQRLKPGAGTWVKQEDDIRAGASTRIPWPLSITASRAATVAATGAAKRTIAIGRGPENDFRFDFPMVSWNHARLLQLENGQLIVEDLGSRNGTYVNSIEHRIQREPVQLSDEIYLGSFRIPVSRLLGGQKLTVGQAAAGVLELKGDRLTIGRDPASDFVVNYPSVSWKHAEITREGGQLFVRDLDSKAGTHINGQRISGRQAIQPGQELVVGGYRLRIQDAGRIERLDFSGNVTIEVREALVTAAKDGKELLGRISLTIFPSEMVALMGTSGAGKTTFLQILNGYTVLDAAKNQGQVLFNCLDLNSYYDQFRLMIGYVPQEDIMHSDLTVREVLYYTARMRTDLTDAEIEQRTQAVLGRLGIAPLADKLIGSPADPKKKVISGGQRKRVNIAIELMVDPDVLIADEPTSGLSSLDSERVIGLLRDLANGGEGHPGKTIIVSIHQPSAEVLSKFDNLVAFVRKVDEKSGVDEFPAKLAYYGPAYPEAAEFFAPEETAAKRKVGQLPSPDVIMSGATRHSGAEWEKVYQTGAGQRFYQRYVKDRQGTVPEGQSQKPQTAKRPFGFSQWWVLCQRNWKLKLRDSGQLLFQLMQALVFGLVLAGIYKDLEKYSDIDLLQWGGFTLRLATAHFMMVVAAIWFGCNNAIRDVVGERNIFIRERMVNLKLPSYVFSKFAVNLVWGLIQLTLMLAIVYPISKLQAPLPEVAFTLTLLLSVGIGLGLLLSAAAPSTETAIALMPIFLLPMILLSGGLTPLHKLGAFMNPVAQLMPTRWAYEAGVLAEARARPMVTVRNPCEKVAEEGQKGTRAMAAQVNMCQERLRLASQGMIKTQPVSVPDQSGDGMKPQRLDIADNAFPVKRPEKGSPGWAPRNSRTELMGKLGAFLGAFLIATIGLLRWRDIR